MMTSTPARSGWRALRRKVVHRTSLPTDALVRAFRLWIGSERGIAPNNDAVIFAALRLAARDATSRDELAAEVARVEAVEPLNTDDPRFAVGT